MPGMQLDTKKGKILFTRGRKHAAERINNFCLAYLYGPQQRGSGRQTARMI